MWRNAYMAGILDGEGYIAVPKDGKPRITITSTSLDLLVWVTNNFGGNFYPNKPHKSRKKESWQWKTGKKSVIENILLEALPYLIVKKSDAIKVLKYIRK